MIEDEMIMIIFWCNLSSYGMACLHVSSMLLKSFQLDEYSSNAELVTALTILHIALFNGELLTYLFARLIISFTVVLLILNPLGLSIYQQYQAPSQCRYAVPSTKVSMIL